jgi:hypothetical protein
MGELFAEMSFILSFVGAGSRRKNRENCSEIQLAVAPVSINPSAALFTFNAGKSSFG